MAERSSRTSWSRQLIEAVLAGEPKPIVYTHLNSLLCWLASVSVPETAAIGVRLRELGVPEDRARRQALTLLERALFAHPDDEPSRVLGLSPQWTRDELRTRYRLLMHVYHPDRASGEPELIAGRAERINRAHSVVWSAVSGPVAGVRASESRHSPRRLRRLLVPVRRQTRVRLGGGLFRPDVMRRVAITVVALGCLALVTHTCVTSRMWRAASTRTTSGSTVSDSALEGWSGELQP